MRERHPGLQQTGTSPDLEPCAGYRQYEMSAASVAAGGAALMSSKRIIATKRIRRSGRANVMSVPKLAIKRVY